MCTVIVLHRPDAAWPVLLAANRDEMQSRDWDPPARHWPEQPAILAGRDRTGGGTWLGINDAGVMAAVLNRAGSLGPLPGKRSRGELPLLALAHATAGEAVAAIAALRGSDYRTFNMVIADAGGAHFIRGLGSGRPESQALGPGLHMVTAKDPNDLSSPRVARHLPRLRDAAPPAPPDDWGGWPAILADRSGPVESQINVTPHGGFATVCASLIGLPKPADNPVWLFAAGPPHIEKFEKV